MFDRSAILRKAWEMCREARTFNGEFLFAWEGREVFAESLRQAWFDAKQQAGRLTEAELGRSRQANHIRQKIDGLKFKSLRYDISRMERDLRAELAQLSA